jgi:histidinol-phosphate aminotransferase
VTSILREEIASLAEYRLTQVPWRIKLNQNENPYELPVEIKQEILRRLESARWSRYPAFAPKEQIEKVAAFVGWRSDGTLLGNGSNELLQVIFSCVLERGIKIVISQPTFTLYRILARSLGAEVHDVGMLRGFTFDVEGIISEARRSSASMIVLCTPNNPTGSVLSREEVVRILESTSGLVLLDEAYVQFAPESRIELLKEYDRLVILQTFSKAMGAAGLRFGYALGPPDMMKQFDKVKLPYNVNIFTLYAAETFIDHWDRLKDWIETIKESREWLRTELKSLPGFKVYPSGANFLLVESILRPPGEVFTALAARGILIRDVSSYPMLEKGLRISVGTPEENRELVGALKEIL